MFMLCCRHRLTIKAVVLIYILTSSAKIASTEPYYYNNDYEKSNIYAALATKQSSTTTTKKESTITNTNKTKKVYNTIIIRRKKPQPQQNIITEPIQQTTTISKTQEAVQSNTIEAAPAVQSQPIIVPQVTVKPLNNISTTTNKQSIMQALADGTNPFKNKSPDGWYLYAMGGYTVSFQKKTIISAIATEAATQISGLEMTTSHGLKKGNGFGFTVGAKIYLNTHKTLALFISPEFFYNSANLAENAFVYQTSQTGYLENVITKQRNQYQIDVPSSLTADAKHMYGFTFRLGFTVYNSLSFFAKASLGGISHVINSAIYVNNATWPENFTDYHKQTITTQWNTPDASNYIKQSDTQKGKTLLLYGVGGGIELSLWNQHFLIRLDYDHYFGNGTFTINKIYARKESENSTATGDAWKIKNSFGILKLTFGFSF